MNTGEKMDVGKLYDQNSTINNFLTILYDGLIKKNYPKRKIKCPVIYN